MNPSSPPFSCYASGTNILLGGGYSLMLGAPYQTGVAYGSQNGLSYNQPVNQVSGFFLLHFKLLSDDPGTGLKRP